jgi:hypothetical protein
MEIGHGLNVTKVMSIQKGECFVENKEDSSRFWGIGKPSWIG